MRYSFYFAGTNREIDIADFGVSFSAKGLKNADVVWINERYYLSRGINIYSEVIRREIINGLIADFGVSVENELTSAHLTAQEVTLVADRYGGSTGSPHGGSGRCGIIGDRNAKGIGKTPLVGENVDWAHSHGFMWLSEAIREAINSEIAAEELPNGAVPVLAIIDAGISCRTHEDEDVERCAIVIRANFLRPAHFERSIYFGTAGSVSSDQYLDEIRTKSAVASIGKYSECLSAEWFIENMFLKIADQIGASRALRLWQGQFLTSNISIDSALVDFGSFRSVANWRRAYGRAGENFGDEGAHFKTAINSLTFYFNKFSGKPVNQSFNTRLTALVNTRANEAFVQTNLKGLCQIDKSAKANDVGEIVERYYSIQQSQRVLVDDPKDLRKFWIFDILNQRDKPKMDAPRSELECAHALKEALVCTSGEAQIAIKNAKRWFMPRPLMYFNVSCKWAEIVSKRYLNNTPPKKIVLQKYVDRNLMLNRRYWPAIPAHFVVISQTVCRGTYIICAFDLNVNEYRVLLEYYKIGSNYLSAGYVFKDFDEKIEDLKVGGNKFLGVFPHSIIETCTHSLINVSGKKIKFTAPTLVF